MLKKNSKNIYESPLFSSIPHIVHGYTTRSFGDMRTERAIVNLQSVLGVPEKPTITGQQVHGSAVAVVHSAVPSDRLGGVDGILVHGAAFRHPPFLLVRVADCVPVLFVDPTRRLYGVAHAGWKGTIGEIVCRMIEAMHKEGSNLSDIFVSVGPSIGPCCYDVPAGRAQAFVDRFGPDAEVVMTDGEKKMLDLRRSNALLLRTLGISENHMDLDALCTSCHVHEFYSYRRDSTESFGEIAGFITLTV